MTEDQTQAPPLRTFVRALRELSIVPHPDVNDRVATVQDLDVPASFPERTIPVRAYWPRDSSGMSLPIIVFAHGGGFVSGSLDTHDVLVRALANRTEALVLSVDYRLAPEHPFPAGMEDVFAVIEWAATADRLAGADPDRVAVCGDSAGANLVTAAAMLARDCGGPELRAQLLLYPGVSRMDSVPWDAFGPPQSGEGPVEHYILAAYAEDRIHPFNPLVAPLLGHHSALPPTRIVVGEYDPFKDDCLAYAGTLADAGVEAECVVYPGQHHGFVQSWTDRSDNAAGETALDEGAEFLRKHLTY
ncbi:MAG: alpha/beta hydrolase [Nocardiaceae bacterium]|nr:alpha/beta hydrolase [Nocardiaceae bacterium]